MYDAIKPFADDLTARVAAGESLADAWSAAATLATEKAAATADLMPKLGRARPLGEKSLGTPDPGATSMAELLVAVGPVIAG
jgi:dihydroxyacetone kinase